MINNFSALFYVKRVILFVLKEPIKMEILQISSDQVKIQNSSHFWKNKSEFLKNFASLFIAVRQLIYNFSAEILYTFNKRSLSSTNLVKFHVNSQKFEVLHFNGFLCPNDIKF